MVRSRKAFERLRSRDFAVMLGALAVFAFMVTFGVRWGIPKAAASPWALTSPAFYPYLVCWAGVVISAVSLAGFAVGETETPALDEPSYPAGIVVLRLLAVLALFALTCVLFRPLGALLTLILAFGALLLLGGERRIGVILAASIGVPVVAFFIFRDLARVPLPAGDLFF